MKQTTAMQTLIDKLKSIDKPSNADTRLLLTAAICDAESLLELEKRQIMDTYVNAIREFIERTPSSERYYTETFKTE